MLAPEELLTSVGIALPSYASGRYTVLCPRCSHTRSRAHQRHPVLGVTIDGDRVRWGCNHCGWTGPQRGDGGNGHDEHTPELKVYLYGDELRKVRNAKTSGPKYFWQHRDADGSWKAGTGGRKTADLLYRIIEARQCLGVEGICVVEGEKDVDTLWNLGIAATCNAHGASEVGKAPKWTRAHSAQLAGGEIIVLNDNDEPGYAHAETVMKLTTPVAKRIGRLDLKDHWPGEMPKGADITDMVEAKAIDEQTLRELLEASLPPEPEPAKPRLLLRYGDDAAILVAMGTIVSSLLHAGSLTLFYGPPKSGKSFLATDLLLSIAAGDPEWMSHRIAKPGPVLYVACEGHAGFPKRLAASKLRRGLFGIPRNFCLATGRPFLVELTDHGRTAVPHPDDILEAIASMPVKPRVVAIDTVFRAAGAANINSPDHASIFLAAVAAIMDLGIAVLLVHHETKSGGSPLGSQAIMAGADTIVRTQNLDDQTHAWEVEYAKDDAATEPRRFALEVVDLGADPEGFAASSCVVVPMKEKVERKARPLKEHHQLFLEHLRSVMAECGKQLAPIAGMPLVLAMTRKELRSGLVRAGWFPTLPGEPFVLRTVQNRELAALEALATRKIVAFNTEFVWML